MAEKVNIQGHWLQIAIAAQKVTPYNVAIRAGISPDNIYNHLSNKHHLNSKHLAPIARAFPTLNVRYVLTGEGSPILPAA